MKHFRWPVLVISLICGAFWGILVGIFSYSTTYGIIAFIASTVFYVLLICLNSCNSSN